MADSENTEAESPSQDPIREEDSKEEVVKQSAKGEPDKKKPGAGGGGGGKVEVRLQAAGDAPIMKQRNYNVSRASASIAQCSIAPFQVDKEKQISWIIAFVRKYLKFQPHESLYLYVNQAFSPSPDQTVGNLAECFAQDNKLVLYYSRGQAWG